MEPDKQFEQHWLDKLGSRRLDIPNDEVVFSHELDQIILEICEMGGLWRLEKKFNFDSKENKPPPLTQHRSELIVLRDELRSKQKAVLRKVGRIFGLADRDKKLDFNYNQDFDSTIKLLFSKRKAKRK